MMNLMRRQLFKLLTTFLLLMPSYCCALELPHEVSQRLKLTQEWLNSLKSKSPENIRKELGEPKSARTWNFQGDDHPLWEYAIESSKSTLLLYFFNGTVRVGSVHTLSE